MSRSRSRRKPASAEPTPFDMARDELFQHVIRCDVIGAEPEHQAEWFTDTMNYMSERWHELSPKQLVELRTLGERFAKPARSAPIVDAGRASGAVADETIVADSADSPEASLDTVSA